MESYRKNRRGFYFSKNRVRLFFFCIIMCFIISYLFLGFIDGRVKVILKDYLPIEVERISGYVVRKVIRNNYSDVDINDFIDVVRDGSGNIERIDYSNKINMIRNNISDLVDLEFYNIESGNYKDYDIYEYSISNKKYKYIRGGFLCDLSVNSLSRSTLFGNMGPTVPIKISFIGYSFADVLVNVREYGINNVIVEIDVVVDINSVISMPVNVEKTKIRIKKPIITEIIQGNVPNYYVKQ